LLQMRIKKPGFPGFRVMIKAKLPDALRLSGLHDFCNILNLEEFVGRIRRSRRIRHEIRRIGLTHLPDAPSYRAWRKAIWHTPAGPHPANYNK
ncbi:hypothetical protein VVG15_19990, partial [Acinetobacter baumannii]|uniref:hypothetical protein n=1 Tax=Acinetobacter baumannii TaxID=470 RepID=UPI00300D4732